MSRVVQYVDLVGLEVEVELYSGPKELCLRVQIAGTGDDDAPLYAASIKTDGDPDRVATGIDRLAEAFAAWCKTFSTELPVALSRAARMLRSR